MGYQYHCRYTETVTFESARPLTEQDLSRIRDAGGLYKTAEPVGLHAKKTILDSEALRTTSTYHIERDIDRDSEREDIYLRLEQVNPAGIRQILGRYIQTTIHFHSGILCRPDRDDQNWVTEPFATITLPEYSFFYGEHIFVGDLTGDGIQDVLLLRDDLNRERFLKKPVFEGALLLAGKKKVVPPPPPRKDSSLDSEIEQLLGL
ncbi:MAG: hypothetical protein HYT76_07595 [Deltaproteobacteria bacterium]|nr:hypothetical protein [Deltaproteobacteria bacterium]